MKIILPNRTPTMDADTKSSQTNQVSGTSMGQSSIPLRDQQIIRSLQEEADLLPENPEAARVVEEVRALTEGRAPQSDASHITSEQAISLLKSQQFSYLTGSAGTGKSYTIREAQMEDPLFALTTATTGIAAVNLNCSTINSTLKFYDLFSLESAYLEGKLTRQLNKIADLGYHNLLIDEVSMLSGEKGDLIVTAIKEINVDRQSRGKNPMGLIYTGDMCLAPETPVMLYSGQIKTAKKITKGDLLMGPDFTPRKVLKTTQGVDHMYTVKQTNGDDYIVNSRHLLALKRGIDGSRLEDGRVRYPNLPDKLTISAEDMYTKSTKFREHFVGYKAGVIQFNNHYQLNIDPYFLGLWLGDGDSDACRITTMDVEILDYCKKLAADNNLKLTITTWNRTNAVRVAISSGKEKGTSKSANKIWTELKKLKVINNKHIPDSFMFADELSRLSLLAGLIDSDGCWSGNRYLFSQINLELAKQVKQLSDQLGFRSSLWYTGTTWVVSIGGDTWRVPCKVERKKSSIRKLGRNRLTSVLTVESAGVGEYCGFEVDKDRLFLLGDGTVTHNCQLPPVLKDREKRWLFEGERWEEFERNQVKLTKVWRQSNPAFLDALNAIRRGDGSEGARILKSAGVEFATEIAPDYPGTTIVAKNDKVERFNELALSKLPGRRISWLSRRWKQGTNKVSEWEYIPEELRLKVGAYVMILANDWEAGYVNGDCGELVDPPEQPMIDDEGELVMKAEDSENFAWVKLARDGRIVRVSLITRDQWMMDKPWGIEGEISDLPKNDGKSIYYGDILDLSRPLRQGKRFLWAQCEYMPLRCAYAATCHKTQGLSLDSVQVDVRDGFFGSPAMIYVALSRARTLEGIRIVGSVEMLARRVNTDPKVRRFL